MILQLRTFDKNILMTRIGMINKEDFEKKIRKLLDYLSRLELDGAARRRIMNVFYHNSLDYSIDFR